MILGISHSKVPIYFRTGPKHPTTNIQPRTSKAGGVGNHWMLVVRCWLLDDSLLRFREPTHQIYLLGPPHPVPLLPGRRGRPLHRLAAAPSRGSGPVLVRY